MSDTPREPSASAVDPLAPEDPTPDEAAGDAGTPPRGLRLVVALIALAFFVVPGLVFLAGGPGGPLARERTARVPALSRGWALFDDTTRYFTQRLPFRDHAVDANTWVVRHVFGTTPTYGNAGTGPDHALPFGGLGRRNGKGGYAQNGGALAGHAVAAEGRHHWVFLQGELDVTCQPPVGFATAVRRWNAFVRTIRDSGRDVVLLVVPEKSTMYPEYLEEDTPSRACALGQKARLWRAVEDAGGPDVVPLRERLLGLKHSDPRRLLYLPLDSHWNDVGALVAVKAALAHVGGGVRVGPRDVDPGTERYTGDIAAFVGGGPTTGNAPTRTIRRPGEDRGAVVPGTTLFLHDSFGVAMAPMLTHYADRLLVRSMLGIDPASIVRLLRSSRTVVVETAERDFAKRAAVGFDESILTPEFLKTLPRRLGTAP